MLGKKTSLKNFEKKRPLTLGNQQILLYIFSGKLAWLIGTANYIVWSLTDNELMARATKNCQEFEKILFLLLHIRIEHGLWWIWLQDRRELMWNVWDKFITSIEVMVNIFELEQVNINVL